MDCAPARLACRVAPSVARRRLSRRVEKSSVAAAGWALTRYAPPGKFSSRRSASFILRRRRLRTTALPTVLAMANANKGLAGLAAGSQDTATGPERAVLEERRARKADRPSFWHVRQPDVAGPSGGGPLARPCRRGSPSGAGTRASWRAGDCGVEKGVSLVASCLELLTCNGVLPGSDGAGRHASNEQPTA